MYPNTYFFLHKSNVTCYVMTHKTNSKKTFFKPKCCTVSHSDIRHASCAIVFPYLCMCIDMLQNSYMKTI